MFLAQLAKMTVVTVVAFGFGCQVLLSIDESDVVKPPPDAPDAPDPRHPRDAGPVELARGPAGARSVAVDSTTVYWSVESDRTVRAVEKDGTNPRVARTVATDPGMGTPGDLAVDALYVYVGITSPVTDYLQGCEVVRFSKAVADASAGFAGVYCAPNLSNVLKRMSVVGAFVYGSGSLYNSGETVFQVSADGTNPVNVATRETGVGPVLSVGSDIYYGRLGGSTIVRFPKPSGPRVDFATGQATVLDLASDGTSLYWVTEGGGVSKLDFDKALQAPIVLANAQPSPYRLAVDGAFVYFTNLGDGTVVAAAKQGGRAPRTLASGLVGPRGLALDADWVYVVTDDGAVVKLPKP